MAAGLGQQPSSTDAGSGDKRCGYVAWDYHARTPAEFGTIFKEKATGCLAEQSVCLS
jgi:hypothetical protein